MAKKKRIPKRIVGVRIPKFLRKSDILRTLLGSTLGRDVVAQALTAAAGAAAAVLVAYREQVAEAGEKGLKKGAEVVGLATDAAQSAAGAAVEVVTEAARSILPSNDGDKARPGKQSIRH